jgi:hypothetical protein
MNCEYVREHYKVPACIGRKVIACGEPGIIAEDMGNYIGINLDKDKPGTVAPYHPKWKIEYLGMGRVRRATRSQRRYQKYLAEADCYDDFRHFLRCGGIRKENKDYEDNWA